MYFVNLSSHLLLAVWARDAIVVAVDPSPRNNILICCGFIHSFVDSNTLMSCPQQNKKTKSKRLGHARHELGTQRLQNQHLTRRQCTHNILSISSLVDTISAAQRKEYKKSDNVYLIPLEVLSHDGRGGSTRGQGDYPHSFPKYRRKIRRKPRGDSHLLVKLPVYIHARRTLRKISDSEVSQTSLPARVRSSQGRPWHAFEPL